MERSLALLPTDINALRRRRGVVRASITRLTTRLRELESKTDQPDTVARAQQLSSKLNGLDTDFKVIHLQIIDLVSKDEDLVTEQDILDNHEDKVASLSFSFQQLCGSSPTPPVTPTEKNLLAKKLRYLEKSIGTTATNLMGLPDDSDDAALFLQHEAQLADYKSQLSVIREELLAADCILEDDPLFKLHDDLEKQLFDCSHIVRRRLAQCKADSPPTAPVASSGVKLPKLDVPVFDGNILNWTQFWEQFCISVHDRKNLSDAEKLVYLRHALKDGSAKTVIEGLSRSGEQYCEAIDCLKARFNRPRLIHQAHVKCILDSPPLKEGNGKELRKLHDIIQQHIRALKSMGHEPSPSFITSVIELKLDTDTMFEWQRHSHTESDVPHYNQLLEYIDQRAQASESLGHNIFKKNDKKLPKPIPSFPTHTTPACIACKSDKHPLYICQSFKGLPHEQKVFLLKSNHFCMNCLTAGHHAKSCRSIHRCRRCQGLHHTLLHFENGPKSTSTPITSNSAIKINSNCLLMTCRVLLTGPDGSSVEARCLLDNASSASFITERIAQILRLPRSYQSVFVSGIEGLSDEITGRFVSQVTASPVGKPDRRFSITAVVVPRVTCDLPTEPIPFALEWDHLSNLTLSDPTFGQPGRIDVLLGINTFIDCLSEGRISGHLVHQPHLKRNLDGF